MSGFYHRPAIADIVAPASRVVVPRGDFDFALLFVNGVRFGAVVPSHHPARRALTGQPAHRFELSL